MAAESSNALLGHPPEARLLLVNADDLGMYDEVNAAIMECVDAGIVRSCSLMPPCPAAASAMALLRERPELPFGVHLTLVCDTTEGRWGPLAPAEQVPSLLDACGELHPPHAVARLLARARIDDVEREFRAQITAVLDAGLAPTHLDWHCLADGGREDVFALTVALAEEHGLAVRAWRDPARSTLRELGQPVVDHHFLDSFALDLEGKHERYAQLLRELPAGLTEWAVHPGSDGARAATIEPGGWAVRHSDRAFLCSSEARDTVAHEGIVLVDYREVRAARRLPR